MPKPKSLCEEIADAPVDLSTDRQIARLKSANSELRAKFTQACNELAHKEERIEALLATQDRFSGRKLEAWSKKPSGQAAAILCLNDWHAEARVDPATINGANEFDPTICRKRLDLTIQKAVRLIDCWRGLTRIDELVVWFGGDLINGIIHEELAETNHMGQTESVLFAQDLADTALRSLLAELKPKRLTVVTSYGNHGRDGKLKRIENAWEHSWEWLAYQNLARQFRHEPRVAFKVERGYFNWLDVQGHAIRFHHGDWVKFGGGVGGITIPLRKAISEWNKQRVAEYDVLGHFHQFVHHWRFVVGGCLVGYTPFGEYVKGEFQEPTQTLLMVDRDRGVVFAEPVFCQ